MADYELTKVYKGHTITIQVPKSVVDKKDTNYVKQAFEDYHQSRYPDEAGRVPPDLSGTTSTPGTEESPLALAPKTSPIHGTRNVVKPYGLMNRELNPSDPTDRLLKTVGMDKVRDFVSPTAKAIEAPISGKSWQGKTADVIEGGMQAGTMLFAPEILAHPTTALKGVGGAILGGGVGKGVANLAKLTGANVSPDTERLSEDVGGLMGGAILPSSPKIVGAAKGALKGAIVDPFTGSAHYRGVPMPPIVASAATGA